MTSINWPTPPEGHGLCVQHNGKYLDVVFNEPSGTWSTMYNGERLIGGFETRERARDWLTQYVTNQEHVDSLGELARMHSEREQFWKVIAMIFVIAALVVAAMHWLGIE